MATAKTRVELLKAWVAERIERDEGGIGVRLDTLFAEYRQHLLYPADAFGMQAFAKQLARHGVEVIRRAKGAAQVCLNIKLKPIVLPVGGSSVKPAPTKLDAVGMTVVGADRTSNEGVDTVSMTLKIQGMERSAGKTPALWKLTPLVPGEDGETGILFEVADDGDEISARVAHEVFSERQRQKRVEGWDAVHDDAYRNGELQRAAAAYAFGASVTPKSAGWLVTSAKLPRPPEMYHIVETVRTLWPWKPEWWKPTDPRRMLVKAGALIIAAIEHIDRKRERALRDFREGEQS